MTDNADGTEAENTEAPEQDESPAQATQAPDEVTKLRSRNAGLDAKVTSLNDSLKEAQARADAAEARAIALAEGKDNGDAELRAQLAAKDAALETVKREAALARIEAKYPETFAVLGDSAASLSADKLAEAEARFQGVADAVPSSPIGNNPPRGTQAAPKTAKERYEAELATFKATPLPWLGE